MVKGWFKHKQLDTKILIFYMQINELQSECLFFIKKHFIITPVLSSFFEEF